MGKFFETVAVPMAFLVVDVLESSSAAWEVLFSTRTLELIIRSLVFTAVVTATAALIGVAAAWITFRIELWGRRVWTVLVMLPLVIPSYVIALTLVSLFGGRGLFAEVTGIGLPAITGFWGAWLALSLSTYPYVFLITRTALRRVDPAYEEAARGLGASSWRAFRTVVLPQLRPSIAAGRSDPARPVRGGRVAVASDPNTRCH